MISAIGKRIFQRCGQFVGNGRGNAGKIKHINAVQQSGPVEFRASGRCNRTARAVIHHARRPDAGPLLKIIRSQPGTAAQDTAGVDAKAPQRVKCCLAERIFRQFRQISRMVVEEGKRNGNVGFGAAIACFE